jgi:hypothetical protein
VILRLGEELLIKSMFLSSLFSHRFIHCQFPTEMSPLTRCAQPAYKSMQLFSLSTFALTRMGQATGMATHVIKRTYLLNPVCIFYKACCTEKSILSALKDFHESLPYLCIMWFWLHWSKFSMSPRFFFGLATKARILLCLDSNYRV